VELYLQSLSLNNELDPELRLCASPPSSSFSTTSGLTGYSNGPNSAEGVLKTVSLPIEPNLKLERRLLFRSDDNPGPDPDPDPGTGAAPKVNPDEEVDDDDDVGNPACGPNLVFVFVSKLLLSELLWIDPCPYELEDGIDACLCSLAGNSEREEDEIEALLTSVA
jgi:hypothetical protein